MLGRGYFIVFLGPVGVGKSTVIRGLARELRARGFKVYTTFIKAFHGPSYIVWVLIAKLLGLKFSKFASPWYVIPKSGRLRLARTIFIITTYVDAFLSIPLKILQVWVFKALGAYVLSEECLNVSIPEYIFALHTMGCTCTKICRIPLRVISYFAKRYVPDEIIVLDSSNNTLRERWAMRREGVPDPIYFALQRTYILANVNRTLRINTDHLNINTTIRMLLERITLKA